MSQEERRVDSISTLLGGMVKQFDQGQHASVPDDQVHQGYRDVTSQVSPADYQQSAEQAFAKLSPEERAQFAEFLRQKAAEHGVSTAALDGSPQAPTPGALATATTAVHQQDPNLLQQMFAPGGTFSSPVAKMVLLGITAFAAKRLSGH
jgi:hypothetical protein